MPPNATNANETLPDQNTFDTAPSIRIGRSHGNKAAAMLLQEAWQAYRSGNLDSAAQCYEKILDSDAQNRDALLGMAAISQRHGNRSVAARYYSRALAMDPLDPYANAGLASMLMPSSEAGTESLLKRLLEQHPDAAVLHFALGNYYAARHRWNDAGRAYSSTCNLEQDNAAAVFNLAVSLDHLGQAEAAAMRYRQALQMDRSGDAGFDHAQIQIRLNELAATGGTAWIQ